MRVFSLIIVVVRVLLATGFSMSLWLAPESVLPGSSLEPARTLALSLLSRTLAFGLALAWVTVTRRSRALAWLLAWDIGLQVFDASVALRHGWDANALVPVVLGVLEAFAAAYFFSQRDEATSRA